LFQLLIELDYLQVLSFIFHMIAVINSLDFHGHGS
jgi:hypothetical protein